MAKKFYITTAIDYVNARPHLGHAYEKILADFLARWHRKRGDDVFFLTGTDENAQKNEQAAKVAGVPVREFVDKNAAIFKELCEKLHVSYDHFIRTTEPGHFKVSQDIFQKVFDKGDIYKGAYEGSYCVGCEAFLTEKELVNGKCPEHGKQPELLKEENYFFKLSKYQDRILKLVQKKGFIQPEHWRNEVIMRLKSEALKDLSVSRVNLQWGIDVPFDTKHKIYVWFDALINYVSGLDYPAGKNYKKFWPADAHLIGKGINWFHSVIWPAMLLSAKIPLPKTILVHGYVNLEGKKMSKTLGTMVDPLALAASYGPDALRYYLLREIPFGSDGDFSEEAIVQRYNNELANDLGNLIQRSSVLVKKNFSGALTAKGKDGIKLLSSLKKADKLVTSYNINDALDIVWKAVAGINAYINKNEPWKVSDREKLQEILYTVLENIRITVSYLEPAIPEAAAKIARQLGFEIKNFAELKFGEGTFTVAEAEVLFPKISCQKQELFPLNLKIGCVIKAEPHPDAEKLLVLQVDLGTEKRQLVAGLKQHYTPEELVGRNIVVVTNLRPAKLRGIESNGMLLAADSGNGRIAAVSAPGSKAGDPVFVEGKENNTAQITIDEFFDSVSLVVKDKKVFAAGQPLRTGKEELSVDAEDGWKVR